MSTLQEFKNQHTSDSRKFAVTNSWGIRDAYKLIRKNHWFNIGRPLKESEFYHIIREVNNLLAEEIALGNTVTFPERMGKLELRKYNRGVSIVNGKLKNTYPINWGETWRLWHEDSEEYAKGTVIRYETPVVYHVRYCKEGATYENKTYYRFVINRALKRRLRKNIVKGKADTLW